MSVVLVIDDDRSVLHLVTQALQDPDVTVITAGTAREGLQAVAEQKPDVVLLDIMLPGTSGLDSFDQIHALDAKLPVIFITAGGSSETAIEAVKLGAYDYLLKPFSVAKVRELIGQALKTRRMMRVPVALSTSDLAQVDGDLLVGRSASALEVYKSIGRVAPQNVTVLIRGESGTGKELVARAIYQHSARKDGPFLAVNCAAIPDALLESELFGHEKGSFTSADSRRIGKFEQCHNGTLFLDEVGDMSTMVQSKVLRLLQEQRFERVGGNTTIQTDVRIITATNRDLEKMVEENKFRADLFYRLNGFVIDLPPLRERDGDIRLLLEYFLNRVCREMGKREIEGFAPETLEVLTRYNWPGNIRELQSVVRQAILNATGPVIVPEFLPDDVLRGSPAARAHIASALEDEPSLVPLTPVRNAATDLQGFVELRLEADSSNLHAEATEMMERYLITRVLQGTDGNQSKAAQILGITRGSLRNKIRSLGISIGQVVSVDQ